MITDKARSISSQEHINHSLETGLLGESQFTEMCNRLGISCKPATQEQQFKHVDFTIGGNIKVDVKGYKRSHENGYVIIEVRNVQGKGGWCSEESEADMIAFDMGMFYHIVPKTWLMKFVKETHERLGKKPPLVGAKMPSYKDVLYRLYRRQGRKDLMMVITANDLYTCPTYWLWRNRS